MLVVEWPSPIATQADAWRVLDLSGMTKSVRQSKNFVKAGFVYLNNSRVNLRTKAVVGHTFTLEIRFPNGKLVTQSIKLIPQATGSRRQRSNTPTKLNYRE